MQQICQRQPELQVTEEEMLCVTLAGLCHDLGHGVLSHFFEHLIHGINGPECKWQHEHASADMLQHIIDTHGLAGDFEQFGLTAAHVHLVKELIFGDISDAPAGWEWRGRPGKEFLFEIVANKRNGVDVDKFDYFSRDCFHLGMAKSFDASRLMQFSRVITMEGEGVSQIAYHEKEVWNLYELFHSRYNLHKRAYKHRVACVIEIMYGEVLRLAEPHLTVPGMQGQPVRIGDAIHDMRAYSALTDYILKRIEFSTELVLDAARVMLRRIHTRQFHTFVGEKLLRPNSRKGKDRVAGVLKFLVSAAALAAMEETANAGYVVNEGEGESRLPVESQPPMPSPPPRYLPPAFPLEEDDLCVAISSISYGMKEQNPVDHIHFYRRKQKAYCTNAKAGALAQREQAESDAVGFRIHADSVSCLVPHVFQEEYLRVFCKSTDKAKVAQAARAFSIWCEH